MSEWIHDYYGVESSITLEPEKDPTGPETGAEHVIRGSNWKSGSRGELRLTYRQGGIEGRPNVGFRIARYLEEPVESAAAVK